MTFSGLALSVACSFSTAALVGARIQSNRRRTVRGRMTFRYSLRLYGPRSRLQMVQMKLAISKWVSGDMVCAHGQSHLNNLLNFYQIRCLVPAQAFDGKGQSGRSCFAYAGL